ncbi:5802_t:CDS:2 [Funneliformis geosporum]|uniref:11699_t:CDS:1 n=1 Tax=Funneliformis geosporum TaxID=1117311 RepID=A0A9W4SDS6_9GLOM|nr:5802_t:CDS:2 [Funneliformis geosporum]CAI2164636.1 11699_t:CDS:2 [Funneliformis geosporum]
MLEGNSPNPERMNDNLIIYKETQMVDIADVSTYELSTLNKMSNNDSTQFRIVNERRFHNFPNCRYPLPNDNSEINRLRLEHQLFRHIWHGNYSAPITDLLQSSDSKVLDIGCGTGIWIEEMSDEFPLAHFTGIDISPIFPQNTSENFYFHLCNIIEGLPFEDNSFDYVHCRNGLTAFSTYEWKQKVIPEMIRVTKPSGFIEHCEVDGHHVNEGPIMKELTNATMEYHASRDVDGMIGEKLDEILLQTGNLYNINHQQKYSPLGGGWGGEYGRMAIDNLAQVSLALRVQLSEVMRISPTEFDDVVRRSVIEAESKRTYFKTHRVYAQKLPLNI